MSIAAHKANGRIMVQGVEIEIVRMGWRGPEVSYLIIPYQEVTGKGRR
jgi:hypothetical protein